MDERFRRLFSSDHVLPRITPNISGQRATPPDPLGDYLDPLARTRDLDVDEVLPAHEWRFLGLTERIDAIAAHHERRLAELLAAVRRRRGNTPWQLARPATCLAAELSIGAAARSALLRSGSGATAIKVRITHAMMYTEIAYQHEAGQERDPPGPRLERARCGQRDRRHHSGAEISNLAAGRAFTNGRGQPGGALAGRRRRSAEVSSPVETSRSASSSRARGPRSPGAPSRT